MWFLSIHFAAKIPQQDLDIVSDFFSFIMPTSFSIFFLKHFIVLIALICMHCNFRNKFSREYQLSINRVYVKLASGLNINMVTFSKAPMIEFSILSWPVFILNFVQYSDKTKISIHNLGRLACLSPLYKKKLKYTQ